MHEPATKPLCIPCRMAGQHSDHSPRLESLIQAGLANGQLAPRLAPHEPISVAPSGDSDVCGRPATTHPFGAARRMRLRSR